MQTCPLGRNVGPFYGRCGVDAVTDVRLRGDGGSRGVLWTEALLKGDYKRVFMFSGKGTIFIFGKKYLTEDQQKAIRQLAAVQ